MKHNYQILFFVIFFITLHNITFGQVKTKIFPGEIPLKYLQHKKEANILVLPSPNGFEQKKNDFRLKKQNGEKENRFAISLPVNINILTEKNKKNKINKEEFSLTIIADSALNLSVEFSEFELMEGDVLSIFTNRELTDSIISDQNNPNKIWATRVYQGDTLSFVLSSNFQTSDRKLVIRKVNFGYKPFGDFGNVNLSAPCHVNVNCPAGNGWDNEKNSVALVVADGEEQCTGALVMNTSNTNIPYFLTADHCLGAGNVPNWVFQFQTWSTDCATSTGWREDVQFNGCQLRANHDGTDFALLQLNTTPANNSGIHYAGWSRQTTGITSTTVIHHPQGDLMKIARDNDAPNPVGSPGVNCWELNLDLGRVEQGSSGASYFNQNHQIIGQHWRRPQSNSLPVCDITVTLGGRFDFSWLSGGTSATRLSNWLDPTNTGAMTTNTTNINCLNVLSINGPSDVCGTSPSSNYSINNLPGGTSVTWQVTPSNIANLSCTTCTQPTLTRVSDGYVTLSATVGGCGTVDPKQIRVGSPYLPATVNGPDTALSNSGYYFSLSTSPWNVSISNITWQVPFGWSITTGQSTKFTTIYTGTSNGDVEVQFYDGCGQIWNVYKHVIIGPGGNIIPLTVEPVQPVITELSVYPNPARSSITVSLSGYSLKTNTNFIKQIRVANKMGFNVLDLKYNDRLQTKQVNIATLKPDIYTIQVYDNKTWYSTKLIKE